MPGLPDEALRHRALLRTDSLEKWRLGDVKQSEMSLEPISPFQESLVGLSHLLNKMAQGIAPIAHIQTEHDAAVYITESLARFLEG